MKKTLKTSLVMAFVFASTINVYADQIILPNGDRISGEIIHISEGNIQVITEYAGSIEIDLEKISDLKTEKPGRISLKSGDMISGRIESISDNQIVAISDALGKMEFPRDLFLGFNDIKATDEELAELQKTKEQLQKTEAELEDATSLAKLWSGSFAVGAQLQRGNTDTSDLRVDAKAKRATPKEELLLRFYSDYGETEGETDTNEVFGQAKIKVFQTDRRYLFGLTDLEYDEMENLDLRAQAFAGIGYNLIMEERTTLSAEIGGGVTGEFFDDNGDDETVEGSLWLSAEWTQKLFENVEFYQGITLFPSLGDVGEYRLKSETTLTTPLAEQWALKLSLIDEYDSDPESDDTDKNDLKFISAVQYTF